MKIRVSLLWEFSLLLGLSTYGLAQASRPTPTLTTDDVIFARPSAPISTAPATSKNSGREEKSPAAVIAKTATAQPPEDEKKLAEKNWQERLNKAQEKARGLESHADQTELTITQLRNQLFSATATSPEAKVQITARLSNLSAQTNRLRAEAKAAQQEVEALQAEGNANQYKAQPVTLTNEKGEPDKQAYQSEQDKLQGELQAARARVEVLQMRLNNNHAETLKKASGDNFTLNRFRQEKEQIAAELAEIRTKIEALTNQLQLHRQKAAAAGIPLEAH